MLDRAATVLQQSKEKGAMLNSGLFESLKGQEKYSKTVLGIVCKKVSVPVDKITVNIVSLQYKGILK